MFPAVRRGNDHWIHDFLPIALGCLALWALVWVYLGFVNADW
jgi:hypothetical protein